MQPPPSAPPRVREASLADRPEWDRFVGEECGGVLLQSWGWGEIRRQFGWGVTRLVAQGQGGAGWRGVLQLLHRPVGLPLIRWAYAPRGPALASPTDDLAGLALLRGARSRLLRRGVVVLRLDPEWEAAGAGAELRRRLRLRPMPFDIQHRRTWLVDITGSEDEVRGRLPPSTRRNVALAERAGVTVANLAGEGVEPFYRLHLGTVARQRFQTRPLAYYQAVLAGLDASVVLATKDGRPLAAAVVATSGPRLAYLYGGSDPGPHRAMYAVHWAAIRWGRERGCRLYDMWGVPRRFSPGDPGPGYAVFKTRWGGRMEDHSGLQAAPWLGPLDRPLAGLEGLLLARRPLLT